MSIDLYRPGFSQNVIPITTPSPLFWRFHKAARHRVAMHVIQLLRDLFPAENIEVIETGQPECRWGLVVRIRCAALTALLSTALRGYALLQDLHRETNISVVRLANEDVEMLRHHHITDDNEFIPLANFFKDFQEQISSRGRAEKWLTVIATAGDEMVIAASIPPAQSFGHGGDFINLQF
jgi:hypothetical protein